MELFEQVTEAVVGFVVAFAVTALCLIACGFMAHACWNFIMLGWGFLSP